MVALDADTGKLKWFYQFTPHDEVDYDSTQVAVLADMEWKGQPRKVMLWANRNGLMYVLDRVTGQFLFGKPFVEVNWMSGFDEKGRPMRVPCKVPTPEGALVKPTVLGATNWYPPSYSPRTGLFYISSWENTGTIATEGGRPKGTGNTPMAAATLGTNLKTEEEGYGAVRAFEFTGDPGLIRLDPRWYQAALQFVKLGFGHILDGTDHLLFLLCLVIPFRRLRALVPIVTAFTVAHSITLIASAYNLAPDALWFPPLVEALIAASILYMALENIVGTANVHRRWMIAFAFGLVHGFGFSFALRETLQFAGSHLLTSLLSFNVGVELGQLLVLALMIPALDVLFRLVVAERMGTIILSAIVAHTAWHWMTERVDRLSQFRFEWPAFTAAQWASLLGWLTVLVALAGLAWLVSLVFRRRGLMESHDKSESHETVG